MLVSRKSRWLKGITRLNSIAVGHGEGKFYATKERLEKLYDEQLVALKYRHADGRPANGEYPADPNGALDDIAGRGKKLPEEGEGMKIFRNGMDYFVGKR